MYLSSFFMTAMIYGTEMHFKCLTLCGNVVAVAKTAVILRSEEQDVIIARVVEAMLSSFRIQ